MNYVSVIVTYNRKSLLLKNLEMLFMQSRQPERVVIIDNHSSDGTFEAVRRTRSEDMSRIDYRYMDENYGGAGGFYFGVKYAYEMGAESILLMDDDGKPFDRDTARHLLNAAETLYAENPLLFLNSLVTRDGVHLSYQMWLSKPQNKQLDMIAHQAKGNLLFGKANPFNGTLITRELVAKIGFPKKEFFLSRDETDYLKRSERAGALIATVLNSIYLHPPSKFTYKRIGPYAVPVYENLDREYYLIRNFTYSYRTVSKPKIMAFSLLRFLTVLLYENQKIRRSAQIVEAVRDGMEGKMGKRTL